MAKSRAGTPAADSFAIASSRRSGRGARGSMRRSRSASIEASETLTIRSLCAAMAASRSRSRVIPADLLVTRQVLEAVSRLPGLRVGITSKSAGITRDLDLVRHPEACLRGLVGIRHGADGD